MIETAVRLFQRHGYHGTSWRTLVAEAGTPWGSAHHHFPGGKEQLALAAIDLAKVFVTAEIEARFATSTDPREAIRTWSRARAQRLDEGHYADGCPIASIALDMAASSPALAAACKEAFERWASLIAARLAASGVRKARAGELGTLAISGFEGALLLARVTRSKDPLLHFGDSLAAAIGAELA